jgi:DNA mismatch endonuclease (patch repair protein)
MRYPKPPPPTNSPFVARIMRANKKANTKPELRVRRALHAAGFRYVVHRKVVCSQAIVSVDVMFRRPRVALFVDGCFWHGCSAHGSRPTTNSTYWAAKIQANRERDRDVDAALVASGWLPVRVWEHDSVETAVDKVTEALGQPRIWGTYGNDA